MRARVLIGLVCGVITADIQLYLRPTLRNYNELAGILLGSLPNFLAVLGLSLIFIEFKKPSQQATSTILAILVGILAHEVFTQSTPSSSFGGMFDWNDILASIFGAIVAYFLNRKLTHSESKRT